ATRRAAQLHARARTRVVPAPGGQARRPGPRGPAQVHHRRNRAPARAQPPGDGPAVPGAEAAFGGRGRGGAHRGPAEAAPAARAGKGQRRDHRRVRNLPRHDAPARAGGRPGALAPAAAAGRVRARGALPQRQPQAPRKGAAGRSRPQEV
ncbi:MAG: hypothetical protein AVDCRST_MAG89-2833, partial [uncultured Gemmatimonadetes bacterium]